MKKVLPSILDVICLSPPAWAEFVVEANQQALRLIVLLLFSFCRKLICSFQNEVMMSFTYENHSCKEFLKNEWGKKRASVTGDANL